MVLVMADKNKKRYSVLEASAEYPDSYVLLVNMYEDSDGRRRGEVYAIENTNEAVLKKAEALEGSRGSIGFAEGNNINPIRCSIIPEGGIS
jgi:hypothetical protein